MDLRHKYFKQNHRLVVVTYIWKSIIFQNMPQVPGEFADMIASHDSSEDYTIISIKKADFICNAWLHIHNRKGFHFSAN